MDEYTDEELAAMAKEAWDEALRLEQERMPIGEENANDAN